MPLQPSTPTQALLDQRQLAANLASLAQHAPEAALSQLDAWISQLRGTGIVPTEDQFAAAPLIDACVRGHYRDATRRLLTARSELSAFGQNKLFEVVESCLAKLAGLHQWLAAQWAWSSVPASPMDRAATVSLPPSPAPVAMAAIRTCAAVRKWTRLFRHDVRPGIWADLCSVYTLALSRNCSAMPCASTPGGSTTTTVDREFLKACMFACVDTGRLLPEQLDIAERAVEYCGEGLVISPRPADSLPFAVDVEAGTLPGARDTLAPVGAKVFYFGLDAQDGRLADLVRQIESGRISPALFGQHNRELVIQALRFVAARLTPA